MCSISFGDHQIRLSVPASLLFLTGSVNLLSGRARERASRTLERRCSEGDTTPTPKICEWRSIEPRILVISFTQTFATRSACILYQKRFISPMNQFFLFGCTFVSFLLQHLQVHRSLIAREVFFVFSVWASYISKLFSYTH